jgi:hypothetical protein
MQENSMQGIGAGSLAGYGAKDAHAGQATRAITAYQEAAETWTRARERLDAAANERAQAEQRHDQAMRDEQEAWQRLESVAGRGVPTPIVGRAPSGGLR